MILVSLMRFFGKRTGLFMLATTTLLTGFLSCANNITKSPAGTELTDGASWQTVVPTSIDTATWTTNSLCGDLTLYGNASWGGISLLNAPADINIQGWGTLTLGSFGIDMSASSVNLVFGNPVLINRHQAWNLNASNSLTITGTMSGASNLTMNGSGTLVLDANNTLTGNLIVNGGAVVINGSIHYNEGWNHLNTLTINSGGKVFVSSGNADNFLGECNYDAPYNVINGGDLQFGTASGAGESINRAFSIGPTNGTIEVVNTNASLTFNYVDPKFQLSVPESVNLVLGGAGNGFMYKTISGAGGLIKTGAGTWNLEAANTFSGGTSVSNGTLIVNGSSGSGPITVSAGATLGGTGVVGWLVTYLTGAIPQFTFGSPLAITGPLIANGNTVHLLLPGNVGTGVYTLATYLPAGSLGTFSAIPAIDTGSLATGDVAQVTVGGGYVNLVVGPPAPHLAITSVNGGSNPNAGAPFNVVVQALDANNNPLIMSTDTNMTLNLNAGTGTLGGTLAGVITAGSSLVTISGVTYSKSENGVVLGVTNTGGTLLSGSTGALTVNLGFASAIQMTSGNNWTGIVGTSLPNPLVVTITDANGNLVAGTNVTFAIATTPVGATGQTLTITNITTDTNGQAATAFTLGNVVGCYTVTASSGALTGSPVVFTATAVNSGWVEVWGDEFDYNGLPDSTKWGYEYGFVRNRESQFYTTNRIQNACVTNGTLIITARKELYTPPGQTSPVSGYTSASLITLNTASWLYGRIEMSAKLPSGLGVWPAFWTQGTNFPQVGWPICGEIDIMEYIWLDPVSNHGNAFYAVPVGGTTRLGAGQATIDMSNPNSEFHDYAIEWDPTNISFFTDGTNYYTFAITNADDGIPNPFHSPQYLLVNFALGGNYNGYQLDDSILPQQYVVDYVRVYKKYPTTPVIINIPVIQKDGSVRLSFTGGDVGTGYALKTSNDAKTWTTLAFLTCGTNGLPGYVDTAAANQAPRYYRVSFGQW
jgi:autotransporter-associated beta strand protein